MTGSPPLLSAAGEALGSAFGALAAVRRTKPLHPKGSVVRVRLDRRGLSRGCGVAWLDTSGVSSGIARFSRSVGLPGFLPDVLGLALRLDGPDGGGPSDLLLATTGTRALSRYLLIPQRDPMTAVYGSLFPYETPRGRVLFLARPGEPAAGGPRFRLAVATLLGGWEDFATLEIDGDPRSSHDEPIDFDPVLHPLPGLRLTAPLAALREPSYEAGRRAR